jgi:hypothetical protein
VRHDEERERGSLKVLRGGHSYQLRSGQWLNHSLISLREEVQHEQVFDRGMCFRLG